MQNLGPIIFIWIDVFKVLTDLAQSIRFARAQLGDGDKLLMYEPADLLFFCPISSLCEKNNPRNIIYMPVVIFFECLDLEPKP